MTALTPQQRAALELLLEIADAAVNLTYAVDDYRRDPKAKAAIAEVEKLLKV